MPPAVQFEQDAPRKTKLLFNIGDLRAEMDVDIPEKVGEDRGCCYPSASRIKVAYERQASLTGSQLYERTELLPVRRIFHGIFGDLTGHPGYSHRETDEDYAVHNELVGCLHE